VGVALKREPKRCGAHTAACGCWGVRGVDHPALGGVAIWNLSRGVAVDGGSTAREAVVNGLIYLIGLIVVIMFILSFLGLH
jgi:hypothetical protein